MSSSADDSGKRPDFIFCRNCKYYYVTWDKHFPWGCKAMGFKSKGLPAAAVRSSSGMRCLLFSPKAAGPKDSGKKKKG